MNKDTNTITPDEFDKGKVYVSPLGETAMIYINEEWKMFHSSDTVQTLLPGKNEVGSAPIGFNPLKDFGDARYEQGKKDALKNTIGSRIDLSKLQESFDKFIEETSVEDFEKWLIEKRKLPSPPKE
jgi:hypothetical protein